MAKASDDYVEQLKREVAQAEADKQAMKEEFAKVAEERWDEEQIKEKFKELLPTAFTSLKDLMFHAESEAVKANLIKYVFSIALSGFGDSKDDKERKAMSKVLAELMGENA